MPIIRAKSELKNKTDILNAWNADKDFLTASRDIGYDQWVNRSQLVDYGRVEIRYDNDTKAISVIGGQLAEVPKPRKRKPSKPKPIKTKLVKLRRANPQATDYNWKTDVDDREQIAIDLVIWFERVTKYHSLSNWKFGTDSKGRYALSPAKWLTYADGYCDDFNQSWFSIKFRTSAEFRCARHVQSSLDTIHKMVTGVLIRLIGVAKTNKALASIRKNAKLKTLRASAEDGLK